MKPVFDIDCENVRHGLRGSNLPVLIGTPAAPVVVSEGSLTMTVQVNEFTLSKDALRNGEK